MHDTSLRLRYLSEPEIIDVGATDMARCIDTMCEVFSLLATGDYGLLGPTQRVHPGDIVVFKFPEDPERDFIKRTIGLPGETIELRNKKVYINGKPLDEPYIRYLFPPPGDSPEQDADVRVHYGPVTVPQGHYFMMGDNRDNSEDSRYWGFMPREYVKGKADFIYWSFEDDVEGQPSTGISRFFTTIRWNRLLHQIH